MLACDWQSPPLCSHLFIQMETISNLIEQINFQNILFFFYQLLCDLAQTDGLQRSSRDQLVPISLIYYNRNNRDCLACGWEVTEASSCEFANNKRPINRLKAVDYCFDVFYA